MTILEQILFDLGDDFFKYDTNGDRKCFYIKNWERFGKDPWLIDGYAILNTSFGYDIGINKAIEIMEFIEKNYDLMPVGINGNNYTENIVRAAIECLNLTIDFSKFEYANDTRYDWR